MARQEHGDLAMAGDDDLSPAPGHRPDDLSRRRRRRHDQPGRCLAGPLGDRYFPVIRAEFDRTVAHVLALKQERALLDSDPALQRSIMLRNPYVAPMSLLQIDMLERCFGEA